MAENDKAKLATDPKVEPTRRLDLTWAPAGTPTVLSPIDGTGGFLIIRKEPTDPNNPGSHFQVQIYVSPRLAQFSWILPDGEDPSKWSVVDVPKGFSINNGESLVKAMKGPGTSDPPVIVHGHP